MFGESIDLTGFRAYAGTDSPTPIRGHDNLKGCRYAGGELLLLFGNRVSFCVCVCRVAIIVSSAEEWLYAIVLLLFLIALQYDRATALVSILNNITARYNTLWVNHVMQWKLVPAIEGVHSPLI